ncbi:MAG: hypothetical protein ACI88H_000619 [Cocleimonas sp.]|jgi:hypothetical protein
MKINRKKQVGATMVAWMIGAGFGILIASAVVKVAPFYVEFNSVKSLMEKIASEPGIKNADKRQINQKIERYLNLNNLRRLEDSYYGSSDKKSRKKNPFKVTKLKKGSKHKKLSVEYPVVTNWFANLSFLMDFKHYVVLGEPDYTSGE